MKRIARSVNKMIIFKPDMLDQLETYMELHSTNFSESVRQIIRTYFDSNQTVTNVSINDSEPVEQPIEDTPEILGPNGKTKNDFNWDGIKL